MAKAVLKADWAPTLRASIKEAGVPRGWSVTEYGSKSAKPGTARLRVRQGAGGKSCWTKNIGIPWSVSKLGEITDKVAALHQLVDEGLSLDQAWAQLNPEVIPAERHGVVNPISGINWDGIANAFFRDRERHGTQIGTRTMAEEKRYVGAALAVLKGKNPPSDPYKLITAALDYRKWTDKPSARQSAVRAICRMLAFGMDHEGLGSEWDLPARQKAKLAGDGKPKEKLPVADLTDAQIIELLAAVPSKEWRNALLLMATYGLRPIELTHLTVKVNPDSGQEQLFCTYRKACGGSTTKLETEERFLFPLPPLDKDGAPISGDLVALMKGALAGDRSMFPLPPLNEKGRAVAQYLSRQSLWKEWTAAFLVEGKKLRPYSFRNSYSVRAHYKGLPTAAISDAMGHSERTHSASYLTSTNKGTAAAFAQLGNKG